MEDLWKRFREETRDHMEKINEFLNEDSLNNKNRLTEEEKYLEINNETSEISQTPLDETSKINEELQQTVWIEKSPNTTLNETTQKQISEEMQQIILEENEISQKNSKEISRKEIYGKMRSLVKEIMEKQNLSRAQAYRKAKKILLENSNS